VFSVSISILILILVIFGGMGSLFGAVLGAAVLQWAPAFLQNANYHWYDKADLYIYYGALLVLMMIFRPIGIVPSRRRRREITLAERGVGTADAMSAESAR
jgi:branched-chain amino acid transport system permease protein